MAELSAVLGRPADKADVCAVTADQAESIYRPRYWDCLNGDGLPAGIDLVAFDFGVNAGPRRSAMRLQGILSVAQDGRIGPKTLAALATHDAAWVVATLTYSHTAYYRGLNGFAVFGAGWLGRAQRCRVRATAMVKGLVPVDLTGVDG